MMGGLKKVALALRFPRINSCKPADKLLTFRGKRYMHGTLVLHFLLSKQEEEQCHACGFNRSANFRAVLR